MLCYRNPLQIVLCKIINDTHKAQVSLESVIISLCPECHQTLHCSDLQRYINYPCCECTGDVFIRRRAGRGRGPVCLVHDRRVPPLKLHFVVWNLVGGMQFLVLSYVYSKQPIFGLTREWLRELSFSRLECGVHDKLHISSADWWDLLLPLE